MKNLITVIAIFLFAGVVSAQKSDKALYAKYTKEELKTIKSETPEEYKYIKYCVKNAFYISEIPSEKIKANPTNFGEITLDKLDHINFYELKLDIKEDDYQSFVIKGTNKILIVKSKKHILRELNK